MLVSLILFAALVNTRKAAGNDAEYRQLRLVTSTLPSQGGCAETSGKGAHYDARIGH
jgi:hypothetical protein